MDRTGSVRGNFRLHLIPRGAPRITPIVFALSSLALLIALVLANLQIPQMAGVVPIGLAMGIFHFRPDPGVFHVRRKQHESGGVPNRS
jgi:hypothetical protein